MNESSLARAISSGGFVVTAECRSPRGPANGFADDCVARLGDKVNAITVSESEDGVRLSSLAACALIARAGVEPMLHILTRDMNRIALQSTILGAASLGVRNVLCTSGRHQALTTSGKARGVFDLDPIQLVSVADRMRKDGVLADGAKLDGPIDILLGADVNPFSDPMELQVIVLEKAAAAGADFVITQPVFNLDRFNAWMCSVRDRGIHERTRIVAGVMPLISAAGAVALAEKYTHLDILDDVAERLDAASDQRSAGITLAAETAKYLAGIDGVGGVHITSGDDAALAAEVIAASGISRS